MIVFYCSQAGTPRLRRQFSVIFLCKKPKGVILLKKEQYENAEVSVIEFSTEDVIMTSGCAGALCPNETLEEEA